MAETTFKSVLLGANEQDGGIDWTNPTSINNFLGQANASLATGEQSDLLVGETLFFTPDVPVDATIDGIEVETQGTVQFGGTGGDIFFNECRLQLADRSESIDNNSSDLGPIPTIDSNLFAGGSADLWGEVLTRTNIIDGDFGFKIKVFEEGGGSRNVDISQFLMKVFFTTEDIDAAGTIVGALESQVAAGGRTIILDLTGVEWLAIGAPFDATRQSIMDSVVSSQSETLGFNNEVIGTMGVDQVVRTSNTRVTITLLAAETANYKIIANELLSISLPASTHTGTSLLTDVGFGTILAECDQTLAPDTIITQTNLSGAVTDIDESVDAPDANWLLVA